MTKDEAKQLLDRAKQRNPGLTREQAKDILMKADQSGFGSQSMWQPAAPEGIEKQFAGGFLQRAISGIVAKSKPGQNAIAAQEAEVKSVQGLFDRAFAEKDPKKKAQLLAIAKDAEAILNQNLSGRKQQLLGNTGWSNDEANKYAKDPLARNRSYWKDATQAALDVGSVIAPSVAPFGSAGALGRIGNAVASGSVVGTLSGAGRAMQADSPGEAIGDIAGGVGVGALAGGATQTGIEGIRALLNTGTGRIVTGSARNAADSIKSFFGKDKESAINEIYGVSKTAAKNYYKQHGDSKNGLAEDAIPYMKEIIGDKNQYASMSNTEAQKLLKENTGKVLADTGKELEKTIASAPPVDLNKLDPEIEKLAKEYTGAGYPDRAKEVLEYWDNLKAGNIRDLNTGRFSKKGVLSAKRAWKLRQDFDDLMYTQAGKEKNVETLSPAVKNVTDLTRNYIRGQLRESSKAAAALFDKYAVIKPLYRSIEDFVGGATGAGTTKVGAFNILGSLLKGATSGTKNVNYLAPNIVSSQPGLMSRAVSLPGTQLPGSVSAGTNAPLLMSKYSTAMDRASKN